MFKKVICFIFCAVTFTSMVGCNEEKWPKKPAGPGGERLQPYNPKNGQYGPNNK